MARWLADTQAIAALTGRTPATIRSWAHRYPDRLPRHGTGKRNRALYDVTEAEQLAAWLATVETPVTMCNTKPTAGACPDPADRRTLTPEDHHG